MMISDAVALGIAIGLGSFIAVIIGLTIAVFYIRISDWWSIRKMSKKR